jgi:hypothetical protein
MSGGSRVRIGRIGVYSWQPRTDRWTWNGTMFRLHGYAPGAVTPTRALWFAHKHPDSREHAADAVDRACRSGATYVCEHRIVAFDGSEREVVGLGYPTPDTPWSSAGRRGYLVDVTPGDVRADPSRGRGHGIRPLRDEAVAQDVLSALDEHLHLVPEAGMALLEWLSGSRARSVDAIARGLLDAVTGPAGRWRPQRALLAAADPGVLPPPDR